MTFRSVPPRPSRGVAHWEQNLAPASFSWPQFGQIVTNEAYDLRRGKMFVRLKRAEKLAQAPREQDERDSDYERDGRVVRTNCVCTAPHAGPIGSSAPLIERPLPAGRAAA